jgi:tetratricopeptide (TPR) repeat protein
MFFNNDDDEDDDGNGLGGNRTLGELISEFNKAKKGNGPFKLYEDDFAFLIDFFETEGDMENARLACEIGVAHYPFAVELLLRKAETLLERQNYGQALKVLDKIDTIAPDFIDAILLRVEILTTTNHYKDAIALIKLKEDRFIGIDKDDLLFELTDIYDELEEYDKVYDTLKQIIAHNPRNEEALHRICFWADLTGQHEDAIKLYQNILDNDPFNALAWYNIGVAYQGIKFHEKAIESYKYCIDIDENFEYAYRNMGDAYMQLKQYDNAIETLEHHMRVGTPEDLILDAIAYCWEKKKDYAQARNYYRKAAALNPHDAENFHKIGETWIKEKQWEKAIKSFEHALKLAPVDPKILLALANTHADMEHEAEAKRYFILATSYKPSVKVAWQCFTKFCYHFGHYQEGLNIIDEAEEFCGYKPEWDYYRAVMHLALGRTKDAIVHLETALNENPKKANAIGFISKELNHHPVFTEVLSRFKKKK